MLKVLTVSGYKAHEIGVFKNTDPAVRVIKKALRQAIVSKIDRGLQWVITSGQLGVEIWTAEVVIELKETYPTLKLGILAAYQNHEEKWNEANQDLYQRLCIQADFVEAISQKPYQNPQQLRNKNHFHIAKSDGLLIVYDEEKEGSPKFLWEVAKQYQESNRYEITQVTFQDLQWIVEEEQWNDDWSIVD